MNNLIFKSVFIVSKPDLWAIINRLKVGLCSVGYLTETFLNHPFVLSAGLIQFHYDTSFFFLNLFVRCLVQCSDKGPSFGRRLGGAEQSRNVKGSQCKIK